MSLRIDSSEWISGSLVIGNTGGGVLAQNLASTGDNGSGFLFNDVTLPADNGKEICGRLTTIPAGLSLFAFEDGSVIASGADGTYVAQYQLYVDYVAVGSPTDITFIFGAGTNQATMAWSEGSETFVAAATATSTTINITLTSTEGVDSAVSNAVVPIAVLSSLTETSDLVSSFSAVTLRIDLSSVENSDTLLSSLLTVEAPNGIFFSATENGDIIASSSNIDIRFASNLVESPDYTMLVVTYTLNTGGEMLNADGDHEFDHAPNASLDYGFDWASSGWLASGETITNSVWTVEAPLVASLEQIVGGVTSLFVTGGVVGKVYKVVNTITTSLTRTDSRTIKLSCKQR